LQNSWIIWWRHIINKERRHTMNTTPTRSSTKSQWHEPKEDPKHTCFQYSRKVKNLEVAELIFKSNVFIYFYKTTKSIRSKIDFVWAISAVEINKSKNL
jgi:hypothetical protein